MKKNKKTKTESSLQNPRITCLLTGFDAFNKSAANPSGQAVEVFPAAIHGLFVPGGADRTKADTRKTDVNMRKIDVDVRKLVLPTSSKRGWKAIKEALDYLIARRSSRIVIVMTGLASGRKMLSLERFAMNQRDYGIADNDGLSVEDTLIEPDAPQLLRSPLPLSQIRDQVREAGFPCQISNHAGTFICNELYFKTMQYALKNKGRIASVLFVHVPELADFAATTAMSGKDGAARRALAVANSSHGQLELLKDALQTVAGAVIRASL